ncbi:MAG: hypothetical protein BGN88_00905 [Clostridiales bacterium 43-6]|nr:MAG: hypothetical protein BGN88_00905 [Clostridiales bacterium 43-6]
MKRFLNKRGDGYLFQCVMIVVVAMILSVVIFYANTISLVRITEENTKIVLDSYVIKNSIIIYNSIKQGDNNTDVLDENLYIKDLCEFCTLDNSGTMLYSYNDDGSIKYKMSLPVISFREANTLEIQLDYTMYVPIQLDSKTLWYAAVPMTVVSSFSEKF